MKEEDYIRGIVDHNPKVLNLIYKNYAHRIQGYITKNGGTVDDAKDVFQDALMVIYNKAKRDDFQLTSKFSTYLTGICRFTWDRKRRKKANNTVTIPEDDRFINESDIEKEVIRREKHNIFRQHLLQLGESCQKILLLFFAKKSMDEIAQEMGFKNGHTARNRKYRCQKELEAKIKKDSRYLELKVN